MWLFWLRPSRKAYMMLTLRPDPSQESKCPLRGLVPSWKGFNVPVNVLFWKKYFFFLPLRSCKICLHLILCVSSSSPIGAIGVSMVTTVERQSICSKRWSPPIRRPSSLTWRALTALCLYPSLTAHHHLPRRVLSKNHSALLSFHFLFSLFSVLGSYPCSICSILLLCLLCVLCPNLHLFLYCWGFWASICCWRKTLLHTACLIECDCKSPGNYCQMGSRRVTALTHSNTQTLSWIDCHHLPSL